MKVFVWGRVAKCSDRYHSEGGIVVFAETEERARMLAAGFKGCVIAEDERPDEVRAVIGGDERVFIMEDAGCC